jgi:hypothetical protein
MPITFAPAAAATVEVALGTPKTSGKFEISDAAITSASIILCWQAPGPYTGKGTRADEAAMAPVRIVSVAPGSGSAVVYWEAEGHTVTEKILGSGRQNISALPSQTTTAPVIERRIGKVGGNVKFSYIRL